MERNDMQSFPIWLIASKGRFTIVPSRNSVPQVTTFASSQITTRMDTCTCASSRWPKVRPKRGERTGPTERARLGVAFGLAGRALAGVLVGLWCLVASQANAAAPHPLDPLAADELAKVKTILQQSGQFSANTDFSWTWLDEPPKKVVADFKGGRDYPRRAYVAAVDYERKKAFDVIVDLRAGNIAALTDLGALQPGITDRDEKIAEDIIDADPAIKAALVARGLRIPGKVSEALTVQFMPVGHDPTLEPLSGRLIRALFMS